MKYKCQNCNKCFEDLPSEKRKYCSLSCSGFSKNGEKNPNWKGGRRWNGKYWLRYAPNHPHASHGYVLEHRLVIEENIGRILKPEEHVHHLDENAKNNNLENLRIVGKKDHSKYHSRVRDFIKNGGDVRGFWTNKKDPAIRYPNCQRKRSTGEYRVVFSSVDFGTYKTIEEAAYNADLIRIQIYGEKVKTYFINKKDVGELKESYGEKVRKVQEICYSTKAPFIL